MNKIETIADLQSRIAFLEQALDWYSDPNNYKLDQQVGPHMVSEVALDEGDRARRALDGELK